MRKIVLALAGSLACLAAVAQCSIIEVPLSQRASSADLIVEGKVTAKTSFWNSDHTMIYTANTIEVYKVFKGLTMPSVIEILTEGGTVGLQKISVEPSLQLQVGDAGIFTCETVKRAKQVQVRRTNVPQYEAFASTQGFIRYDLATQTATDPFRKYTNIEAEIFPAVLSPSFRNYKIVQPVDLFHNNTNRLQGPVTIQSISGFSPTTVTAGTGTQLTITGSGFGSTQGSGTVGFKNADDGGATYINPLPTQYISWSNTQIVVEVPSNAGTGTIQVTQGTTTTSTGTLTVSYAHLNVEFDPGSGTIAYQTDHIDDNGAGGYTWQMNPGFDGNASARAAFMRAFDSWRCATGINWTIGSNTNINDAVSDGTNVICFDNTAPLSAGILGVCYSYWSGCASGPTIVWYVNELDIIFDDGSNISPLTWEYGPATPSTNEYDFESVAVHELGHGHQLGHVIASGQIMHYALSNGAFNRTLSANDLAGANFVQSKSVVANVCGPGAMTNYSCASAPVADFSGSPTSLCPGGTVTFTDLSTNTPTSWSWSFTGGTPSTSTLQNPTITYSTAGTYAVTLTATNSAGSDAQTYTGYITVYSNPSVSGVVTNVTCNGGSDGAINLTPSGGQSPYTFLWNPSGQTTEDRTGLTAGTYSVTVLDAHSCSVQSSATVTQPTAITASVATNNVTCNGGSDGSATITASGGAGGYSYSWAPSGGTAATATGLAAGTYTCTIVDASGCTRAQTVTITQPAALSLSLSKTDATCANNDGTATAAPSGGTGPYVYSWSPGGQTTQTITGLSAGTYTCTIVDSHGCTANNTVTVVSNPCGSPPVADFSGSATTICSGSSVSFTDLSTNTPTSWSWTFTGGTPASSTAQNPTVTYSAAGTYAVSLTVQNASGSDTKTVNGYITVNSCGPTQLAPSSCGITLTSLSQQIYCVAVSGATNYRYRFTNAAQGYSQVFPRNGSQTNFYMSWATGIQYGRTYDVEVAAYIGGSWTAYGTICTVTTPASVPTTQLTATYCGSTVTDLSQLIYATAVPGATNYRWRITQASLSYSQVVVRNASTADFRMIWASGVQYGQTYDVEVAPYVGGVWGSYGAICTITTPGTPTTQLTATYCNTTTAALSTQIFCTAVSGATNYQWKVENAALGYSSTMNRGSNLTNWYLSWNSGTQINTTYTVTVRAYVGGSWGSFGPACTITTGPVALAPGHSSIVPSEVRLANPDVFGAGDAITMDVFPNPFADVVTIVTSSDVKSIAIFNAFGEKVRTIDTTGERTEVSLADLTPGVYFMEAVTENGVVTKKVIRQ